MKFTRKTLESIFIAVLLIAATCKYFGNESVWEKYFPSETCCSFFIRTEGHAAGFIDHGTQLGRRAFCEISKDFSHVVKPLLSNKPIALKNHTVIWRNSAAFQRKFSPSIRTQPNACFYIFELLRSAETLPDKTNKMCKFGCEESTKTNYPKRELIKMWYFDSSTASKSTHPLMLCFPSTFNDWTFLGYE